MGKMSDLSIEIDSFIDTLLAIHTPVDIITSAVGLKYGDMGRTYAIQKLSSEDINNYGGHIN